MYKIGLFSKMNNVTIKTLRYYDEIGLLKPSHVDEFTGFRYYTADQMPRLYRILMLKGISFSINEIFNALEEDISANMMINYLEGKQAETIKTIRDEQAKLIQIQSYLKILKQVPYMSYNIVIKELPGVIVASMRRVIPNFDAFSIIYPEMDQYLQIQKLKYAIPEYCFTIYHDGNYKEADIDAEFCQAVTDYARDSDQVKFKKIAAVDTAACVLHKGPYDTIGMAYGAVMKWIEANGYEITGIPRESYINGCWNKENPEDRLTEVQVPVKLKK